MLARLARAPPLAPRAARRMSTATDAAVRDESPLVLYTAPTPNGRKVSILLEELKARYGVDYAVYKVDLGRSEQKDPWFLALNPNGRIPALLDRARASAPGGFPVFESAAILLYLAQHYDAARAFAPDPSARPEAWSEVLQWTFFVHGGVGPMQGQANHFVRFAPEAIPYAQTRYLDESKRLWGVLDSRLRTREWLAGGAYTVADMSAYSWVAAHAFCGVESMDAWPGVKAWLERMAARPGVRAGMQVP